MARKLYEDATPAHGELLTPSVAAVIAGVTVRDVNRVIDEHIVPTTLYSLKGGRWLSPHVFGNGFGHDTSPSLWVFNTEVLPSGPPVQSVQLNVRDGQSRRQSARQG